MDIADYWLSFSGKFLIPESPDTEKYAVIAGEFEFGDVTHKPNEDGTYDAVYKITPIRVMVSKGEKKLIAKIKNKNSGPKDGVRPAIVRFRLSHPHPTSPKGRGDTRYLTRSSLLLNRTTGVIHRSLGRLWRYSCRKIINAANDKIN